MFKEHNVPALDHIKKQGVAFTKYMQSKLKYDL